MNYWEVKAQVNADLDKDVMIAKIVALVKAEDANETIIKMIDEFPQYQLFITSVKYCK